VKHVRHADERIHDKKALSHVVAVSAASVELLPEDAIFEPPPQS
jgi:hypothetical protein